MAKYNTKKKYNVLTKEEGARYNSATFIIVINLFDVLATSDKQSTVLAQNIISEKANVFSDFLAYAMKKLEELFRGEDKQSSAAVQTVSEDVRMRSVFNDIVVRLYLREQYKVLEDFMRAITFLENLKFNETTKPIALQQAKELVLSKEAYNALADVLMHEYTSATDHEPRKAINDFLIGFQDSMDRAFEYFLPLGMLYDPDKSSIQVMPQSENTYIEVPYVDGSIIENTVYKNRFFNIVAWSQDGLSIAQKEQLKADIARLLDATKDAPRKLTFQKSSVAFDVKYSGNADIKEGPSFVRASIPFEAPPYGYPLFSQKIYGTGLLINRGDAVAYPENVIKGKCANPSFQIGNVNYLWEGTVPEQSKLVINHENMTCYLEDTKGNRINVLTKLTGDFQSIQPGKSIQINAFGDTAQKMSTNVIEKILWKK